MYVKNPNLRGEENINLTKEYLQEKVSFQPDLGEEEDNKVCFEYFRYLLKYPDHKRFKLTGLMAN